jgi:hypothetical protein
MFSTPNILAPVHAYVPAWLLLLSLLAVSLILIFAGRTLVKVVAFVVVGFAGAAVGGTLAVQFLPPGLGLVGILLGFVLGGLLGVALISVGIGLAVGYAAYLLALDLALGATIALVAGVAFFIVGLALSSRILAIVTAIAGGLLLFHVLTDFGLGTTALLIAAVLTLAGLWVQLAPGRRIKPPTAAKAGGQQHDHG